jgi:hypothetical protein
MAFLKLFKNAYSFKAARFKEEDIDPVNPDRGWFHLYAFDVTDNGEGYDLGSAFLDSGQSVVLILIRIGKEVTSETEKRIKEIINHFHSGGKDIVLRVTYDTKGHALEKEPVDLDEVLACAEMIGKLISDLGDKVFVYQGLLIGNWGEMHTSRYDDLESLKKIYMKFCEGIGDASSCYLSVRRPDIHMTLTKPGDKLGLFNDAIFASEDELGTFADPEIDSEYESKVSASVPYGGETVFGNGFIKTLSDKEILGTIAKKKITYLNCEHDLKLLDHLRGNHKLFGYISSHLGYRLYVSNASFAHGTKILSVKVNNSGFAPVYRSTKSSFVYTDSEGNTFEQETELDLSKSMEVKAVIPDKIFDEIKMTVTVLLNTVRRCDGRKINFVNTPYEDGRVYLGELY